MSWSRTPPRTSSASPSASPTADAESLYEAPRQAQAGAEPALARRARQKLEAAEVLLRQGCPVPAAELLLGAGLCAGALRSGLDTPPDPKEAGVWLYAQALPSGKLQQEEAALLTRALTLAQSQGQIPADLLATLSADVGAFVADAAGDA